MVELPTSVKIGYRVFKIVEWDHHVSATKSRFGECDKNAGEIRLTLMFGRTKAANTLLHEILHACYDGFNIQDADDEERTVGAIGDALCTIWVDNPEIFVWIATQLQTVEEG
jgi:hypothetical protein